VVATVDCESVRARFMDVRWSKICSEVRGASAPLGRFSVGVEGVGGGGISACSWGASGAGGALSSAASDACSEAESALLSRSSGDGDAGSACASASTALSTLSCGRGGASVSAMVGVVEVVQ
jgi:hypothetical protein